MLIALGWMLVTCTTPTHYHPTAQHSAPLSHMAEGPGISVWMDRELPYQRGDRARIFIRTAEPAYVAVLRVDTDGQLRMLFPAEPWRRTRQGGGRTFEVTEPPGPRPIIIDDFPGVGYLLAIASSSPFRYEDVTRGDYWDFRAIDGGRVRHDPYVALAELAERLAGGNHYGYDIARYQVSRHFDFPRFICYDCHSYASYEQWDPYATACARFRVVVYDDPLYYPYRYQGGGRRVVVNRPLHPSPMYVFKDAHQGTEYVSRVHGSPEPRARRMMLDRGRTSADVGGPGAVPTPSFGPRPNERVGRPETPLVRRAPRPDSNIPLTEGPASREPASRAGGTRAPRERRATPQVERGPGKPRSTGEPELRRRRP
jgi:hypothetical protein